MRDLIIEEIFKDRIPNYFENAPDRYQERRRGYVKPTIPPANRYPHSLTRAELERCRQPWNKGILGIANTGQIGL